jgi:hypothetical protein
VKRTERSDRQIVLRIPMEAWTRAEKLAKQMAQRPEYIGMRVTPSTALRFAMLRGLDVMEREGKRT